jgi:hypothetical protein
MLLNKKVSKEKQQEAKNQSTMMETDSYIGYLLNGVTYIPHYYERVYVSPGYGFFHSNSYLGIELKALGAKAIELTLWPRKQF